MTNEIIKSDICIIGAGASGLVIAAGAASLGVNVVLIEESKMGGDCLNYGCVPSKALLYTSKLFNSKKKLERFGVEFTSGKINFSLINEHVQKTIDSISPMDSEERFRGMGVNVIKGSGKFISNSEVLVGTKVIRSKYFVIASGSSPKIPKIHGIDSVPYYTNETVFNNMNFLENLIIIGGGPVGVELAQAYNNLGSEVIVIDKDEILSNKEPELKEIIVSKLSNEGIKFYENVQIEEISCTKKNKINVSLKLNNKYLKISGSHLLVAIGRAPNVDSLGLKNTSVKYSDLGVGVNSKLRTSNKRIYAAGDVIGRNMFTHAASYEASIILKNILFRVPSKNNLFVPQTMYTYPEYASIGLDENEAKLKYKKINVLRWPISENDRAKAELESAGLIKAITTKRGKILGVQIVAPNAGDLVVPWILAVNDNIKISKLAGAIFPYPTFSEITKRTASLYFEPYLFKLFIRKIVKFFMFIS